MGIPVWFVLKQVSCICLMTNTWDLFHNKSSWNVLWAAVHSYNWLVVAVHRSHREGSGSAFISLDWEPTDATIPHSNDSSHMWTLPCESNFELMDEIFPHISGILVFSYCETCALNLPYLSMSNQNRNPGQHTQHRQQDFSHFMGNIGFFIRTTLKPWAAPEQVVKIRLLRIGYYSTWPPPFGLLLYMYQWYSRACGTTCTCSWIETKDYTLEYCGLLGRPSKPSSSHTRVKKILWTI